MTDDAAPTASAIATTGADVPAPTAPVSGPSRTGADLPAPPPDVVEAARSVPEHWITVVDPGFDGEDAPPRWALVGAWRTDADGEIVEWIENDLHRASPTAMGWPRPTDQLDGLAQRVVTGYAPAEMLLGVLADSDVLVLLQPDGSPVATTAADGSPSVPVYSSPAQVSETFAHRVLPVRRLLDLVPADHQLLLNPGGVAVLSLDPEPLRDRVAALDRRDDA